MKLSALEAPVLAGVVREKTTKAAIAEIKNCWYDGAGMIDLHMSCLESSDTETLKEIMLASKLPVLALHYNRTYDWQDAGCTEEERADAFMRAVDAGAATRVYNELCDDKNFPIGTVFDWRNIE